MKIVFGYEERVVATVFAMLALTCHSRMKLRHALALLGVMIKSAEDGVRQAIGQGTWLAYRA